MCMSVYNLKVVSIRRPVVDHVLSVREGRELLLHFVNCDDLLIALAIKEPANRV